MLYVTLKHIRMDGALKYTSSLWTNELEPDRRTSADAQRVEISHIWQIR